MSYSIVITTHPTFEPVLVDELKAHLRLNTTAEDSLLCAFISTARMIWERLTLHTLGQTTFTQYNRHLGRPIYLMRGIVSAINSVQYLDINNTWQNADSLTYSTDILTVPANIHFYQSYPTVSFTTRPVSQVQFVAGYSTQASIPHAIKTAIKLYAAHLFLNRASYSDMKSNEVPMGFQAIAGMYTLGLKGNWGMDRPLGEPLTLTQLLQGATIGDW